MSLSRNTASPQASSYATPTPTSALQWLNPTVTLFPEGKKLIRLLKYWLWQLIISYRASQTYLPPHHLCDLRKTSSDSLILLLMFMLQRQHLKFSPHHPHLWNYKQREQAISGPANLWTRSPLASIGLLFLFSLSRLFVAHMSLPALATLCLLSSSPLPFIFTFDPKYLRCLTRGMH